jgi:PLP dependent protein
MVDLITELSAETVAANLDRVRREITEAGRDPAGVQILAAIKYLPRQCLPALAAGGITVVGENRAQELITKQDEHGDLFAAWDFIGALQSRKVKDLIGRVRYIHSVASDSVLEQLAKHAGGQAAPAETASGDARRAAVEVLIEVNVARETGKSGIEPEQLEAYLERCPVPVVGLMTMPPQANSPQQSRPYFAALRELAERFGLPQLSMGTSQDYGAAVAEGATIIRLGSLLYRPI